MNDSCTYTKGFRPSILCIGGTTRAGSSTERALRYVARSIEGQGGIVKVLAGPDLVLPNYSAGVSKRPPAVERLLDDLRACHGIVIASPGYHGNYSGLIKNVLDYVEDLADCTPPYLQGRAVGCIASAYGWQAIGTTLVGLRSVIHALGGWNVPIGASINSTMRIFDESGDVVQEEVRKELEQMIAQLLEFTRMKQAWRLACKQTAA